MRSLQSSPGVDQLGFYKGTGNRRDWGSGVSDLNIRWTKIYGSSEETSRKMGTCQILSPWFNEDPQLTDRSDPDPNLEVNGERPTQGGTFSPRFTSHNSPADSPCNHWRVIKGDDSFGIDTKGVCRPYRGKTGRTRDVYNRFFEVRSNPSVVRYWSLSLFL